MTTIAAPANFEGKTPKIDLDDAAVLLIDHQSGLFHTVGTRAGWRCADLKCRPDARAWCGAAPRVSRGP
jgi:hypothetical protein